MLTKTKTITNDAISIRKEVFMLEQGFKEEFDEIDSKATHLVYYEDNEPAAVCRYYPDEKSGGYILGRIAVKVEYRGKNLGKYMVETAEREIRKEGADRIALSAQVSAKQFYQKCGFTAVGDIYLDENCPHIFMVKELNIKKAIIMEKNMITGRK